MYIKCVLMFPLKVRCYHQILNVSSVFPQNINGIVSLSVYSGPLWPDKILDNVPPTSEL